ncbi:MAG: rRNA maturation RNase YbeY [Tannerella sp.]|jgi:rRNA maturation RNase YbeY|nr:rRNA maturation RNase YbeY [Tannerella sp.]
MAITFHTENTAMPSFRKLSVRRWIRSVAAEYGKTPGAITYIFCTDVEILSVNRAYMHHDYYTDIITFDYSGGNDISGDLFISLDTVRSNSEKFATAFSDELLRVMIHGVLHLCGLSDKSREEQLHMRQAEDAALSAYSKNFK